MHTQRDSGRYDEQPGMFHETSRVPSSFPIVAENWQMHGETAVSNLPKTEPDPLCSLACVSPLTSS